MRIARAAIVTAALIAAPAAFAHAGEPLAPHDLWTAWKFEPGVVIPLALSAMLYARGRALAAAPARAAEPASGPDGRRW